MIRTYNISTNQFNYDEEDYIHILQFDLLKNQNHDDFETYIAEHLSQYDSIGGVLSMTTKFQSLITDLETLSFIKISAYLPKYIDQLNRQELSFTEAMLTLTEAELKWGQESDIRQTIKRAKFPKLKSIRDFDFDFQPSINRQGVLAFQRLSLHESAGKSNFYRLSRGRHDLFSNQCWCSGLPARYANAVYYLS